MNTHNLYPLLASRRRMLRLSQQELAVRAGLRREKVNRLESRHEDIGFNDLCRLLDAMGLELSVSEKRVVSSVRRGIQEPRQPAASAAKPSRDLAPADFEKSAFIDGARAKIIDWGKVPR